MRCQPGSCFPESDCTTLATLALRNPTKSKSENMQRRSCRRIIGFPTCTSRNPNRFRPWEFLAQSQLRSALALSKWPDLKASNHWSNWGRGGIKVASTMYKIKQKETTLERTISKHGTGAGILQSTPINWSSGTCSECSGLSVQNIVRQSPLKGYSSYVRIYEGYTHQGYGISQTAKPS